MQFYKFTHKYHKHIYVIQQFIFKCKYNFCNGYIQFFLDFGDQIQSGPQFGSYFHFESGHYQLFGQQIVLTYKRLHLTILHQFEHESILQNIILRIIYVTFSAIC